jgi:hypothetical protein
MCIGRYYAPVAMWLGTVSIARFETKFKVVSIIGSSYLAEGESASTRECNSHTCSKSQGTHICPSLGHWQSVSSPWGSRIHMWSSGPAPVLKRHYLKILAGSSTSKGPPRRSHSV